MAIFVLTDPYIAVNGVDMSSDAFQVSLDCQATDNDISTFGSGWQSHLAGMKSGTLSVSFRQDFAASDVDSRLWAIFNAGANVTFEVRPTTSAVGSGNPKFTGSICPTGYQVLTGSVGDVPQTVITWPTSGTVTRATS